MNIILALVSFVVNILIKIGDAIIFLVRSPVKIILRQPLFGTSKRKKVRSGTFKLPVKRRAVLSKVYKWYLARLALQKEKRSAEKRKLARIKNGIYRPSFLYKLKYVFVGFIFSFVFLFLPLVSFIFVQDLPNPSNFSL